MDFGVYIGRFNPIHEGHQAVIDSMMAKYGPANCMVIIGSCNNNQTLRHFFSYSERRKFIQTLYPSLLITGIPDYQSDIEWVAHLDDIIHTSSRVNLISVQFFGGCEEDVSWLSQVIVNLTDENVSILNRFDGTTPKISATEVRDSLIHNRSLDGMISHKIQPMVANCFIEKWEEFQKK